MKYISAQPETIYYAWQIETMIHSFLKQGVFQSDIVVLLANKGNDSFDRLRRKYEGVEFLSYPDESDASYAPAIKPFLMSKYFSSCVCKSDEQYFYCDADVILTKPLPNFKRGLTYLSDTVSYIGYNYIVSKGEEVLDLMCKIVGIDKNIIEANQDVSGGCQFVFDGTDKLFWINVYNNSLNLSRELSKYNLENKDKYKDAFPIQNWTAEMWATLWQFWKVGKETKISNALDFAWSTCINTRYKETGILHNAGVSDQENMFKKFEWQKEYPPLDLEITNEQCSGFYYEAVKEATRKKTISLVIPTMWKSDRLVEMIKKYQDCYSVTEIIIIDNSRCFYENNVSLNKIKLIPTEKNTYVNPAWNEGVKQATSDIVCIINDDISPDIRVFEWIANNLKENIIIGSGKDNFNKKIEYKPKEEKTENHTYGWGTFFAMHRKDWVDIPSQFKIFYGDTWFFEHVNKECRIFSGVPIEADMNTTVMAVPESNEIHIQEIKEWAKLKKGKLNLYDSN